MDIKTLFSIGLFTSLFLLTFLFWREYLQSPKSKEGFTSGGGSVMNNSLLSDEVIKMISKNNEQIPTDQEAIEAHQTLLRYISHNYPKGVKFIMDFRDRFFGEDVAIRSDIDVRRLLDNYQNPLQRL